MKHRVVIFNLFFSSKCVLLTYLFVVIPDGVIKFSQLPNVNNKTLLSLSRDNISNV